MSHQNRIGAPLIQNGSLFRNLTSRSFEVMFTRMGRRQAAPTLTSKIDSEWTSVPSLKSCFTADFARCFISVFFFENVGVCSFCFMSSFLQTLFYSIFLLLICGPPVNAEENDEP